MAQATTGSLDALHAYSLALDQGRVVLRVEAIPHLRRAIELDPNFAMAHALLSGIYRNVGRSADAPEFSRRAFELRDRVSERERFFISWRYYVDAEQAWDKALDLALEWTSRKYPREAFAFNSSRIAAAAFGQHEQAVTALQEAVRLDDRFAPAYANLVGSLIALNRFDQARAGVKDAAARGVDFITLRRMSYLLAFLVGDTAASARELDWVRTSQAMWASTWGRIRQQPPDNVRPPTSCSNAVPRLPCAKDSKELAAQWKMEDAESHAIGGECGEARRGSHCRAAAPVATTSHWSVQVVRLRSVTWRKNPRSCRPSCAAFFPTPH